MSYEKLAKEIVQLVGGEKMWYHSFTAPPACVLC